MARMHRPKINSKRFVPFMIFVALISFGPRRSLAQEYSLELREVRDRYLASAEDKSMINAADSALDALPDEIRESITGRAYAGALEVMRAKHAFWPVRKLKYVKRGLRVLDELVTERPRNAEVRYLRLISCYYLPGLFNRGESVAADFAVLSEVVTDLSGILDDDLYLDLLVFLIEKGELDQIAIHRLEQEHRSSSASLGSNGRPDE